MTEESKSACDPSKWPVAMLRKVLRENAVNYGSDDQRFRLLALYERHVRFEDHAPKGKLVRPREDAQGVGMNSEEMATYPSDSESEEFEDCFDWSRPTTPSSSTHTTPESSPEPPPRICRLPEGDRTRWGALPKGAPIRFGPVPLSNSCKPGEKGARWSGVSGQDEGGAPIFQLDEPHVIRKIPGKKRMIAKKIGGRKVITEADELEFMFKE
ncbi:hypothetical protein P7C70_g8751, partial [Phenoliferia sp. Uapishka_3]